MALTEAETLRASPAALRLALLESHAMVACFQRDFETAARTFGQLRRDHRALGNAHIERRIALLHAEVEHARGHSELAITLVREVLPGARAQARRPGVSVLLANLAGYLVALLTISAATARIPSGTIPACRARRARQSNDFSQGTT